MRKILGVLLAAMFIVSLAGLTQARGAPQHNQPFAIEKVVNASPVVASIPLLSAVDQIQNISEPKTQQLSVTTERRGQSTTGAWRNGLNSGSPQRGSPELVLLV